MIEEPRLRGWGPFMIADYPAANPYRIYTFILMVPFTRTRASMQLRLTVFRDP